MLKNFQQCDNHWSLQPITGTFFQKIKIIDLIKKKKIIRGIRREENLHFPEETICGFYMNLCVQQQQQQQKKALTN